MANTKTTIPTRRLRYARWWCVCFGFAMFMFGCCNLLSSLTLAAEQEGDIDAEFTDAQSLGPAERLSVYKDLMARETAVLAQRPSNPYGWARLAYLRQAATGDMKGALAALVISDFVSPFEGPEMAERATMWYRFRQVETPDQTAYLNILWQRAALLGGDEAWKTAVREREVDVAIAALQKTDPTLARDWQGRKASLR